MKAEDLIVKYLDEARIMQLATCTNNIPWCCTVYFAIDNQHNLYWISLSDRQHSDDIAGNPHVAGAMVLPHEYGQKVRGVQFRGTARQITEPKEIILLADAYAGRFSQPTLADDIISGKNPHQLYQVKPEVFVLFDEVNFPEDSRQEWYVN